MTAILYPVAETVEQALNAPAGFAEREREAVAAAGGAVVFTTESTGPAFASEAEAQAAYADTVAAPGEWRSLRPVVEGASPPAPVRPVNTEGKRWPAPSPPAAPTRWRLSVSYWRIERAADPVERETETAVAARKLRRDPMAEGLDARALQSLAAQPLRPAEPQKSLDIGLFEVRLPEAPDRIIPDE